jgi:glycosyltransferase involved in cell wall biosynthesis
MKVLILAFGHSENVLCMAQAAAAQMEVTVCFCGAGDRFRHGILDVDLTALPYGLTQDSTPVNEALPGPVRSFIGDSFRVWFFRTPSLHLPHRDPLLRNYRLCRSLAAHIRRSGLDVIHYNGTSGFMLYLSGLLRSLPAVWTLHDYQAHSGEEKWQNAWLNRFLVGRDFQFVQHYAHLRSSLIEKFGLDPNRVHHVPSGSLDIYPHFLGGEVRPERTGYALYFGRISKYKGIPNLVRAFREVARRRPEAQLVIAGAGPLHSLEEEIASSPNMALIHRYISTSELASLIAGCRFVVAPYTDATHSAVVATAFAFRKPVVATRVGGLPEVVKDGETGLLVEPQDEGALAKAMDRMIGEPGLAERMGEAIREFCERGDLSWVKIGERYAEVYRRAIALAPAGR